jgi:hypothetical protein
MLNNYFLERSQYMTKPPTAPTYTYPVFMLADFKLPAAVFGAPPPDLAIERVEGRRVSPLPRFTYNTASNSGGFRQIFSEKF